MEKDVYSFIVRIWRDTPDAVDADPGWRGSIDLVGSGKRFYFQDAQGMICFIKEQTGAVFQSRLNLIERMRRVFRALRVKKRRPAERLGGER